ncbi:hypothetical protein J6590_098309 [Homalodisca vitripennis]|nr:hypothetical protein J6590_098309 [Homalodisca vitripennis]
MVNLVNPRRHYFAQTKQMRRPSNEYEKIGQRNTRRHYSPTREQRAGAVTATRSHTYRWNHAMCPPMREGVVTSDDKYKDHCTAHQTIKIVTTTNTVTTRSVSSARICATVNSALSGHNTLMYHGEYPESYKPRRPMTAAGCSDVDAQPVQPRQNRRLTEGGNSSKQRLVEYLTPARARVTHST